MELLPSCRMSGWRSVLMPILRGWIACPQDGVTEEPRAHSCFPLTSSAALGQASFVDSWDSFRPSERLVEASSSTAHALSLSMRNGGASSIQSAPAWPRRESVGALNSSPLSRSTRYIRRDNFFVFVLLLLLWMGGCFPFGNLSGTHTQHSQWGPLLFVEATTVHYRGSVYHGLTEDMLRKGGSTFSIQVSIPTFPTNVTLARPIVMAILTAHVRLVDDTGALVDPVQHRTYAGADQNELDATSWRGWQRSVAEMLSRSAVEVSPSGHTIQVTLGSSPWVLPAHTSALVVPCLPFSLFERVGRLGLQELPQNCLAGDPFIVRKTSFLTLDEARWRATPAGYITGRVISIPLTGTANTVSDKFAIERQLRVMEGYTCLHTRSAFVRGSRWDLHDSEYRFTPHRGGVQTLCYTPYPETLPFLWLKLMDSYEVAGPEGVSTDPPQVHAELEFTGTIYGTNLTERDTVVITDELCTDFTSQNVFFVDLFFSSSSRVSFFGTFHKRGIYHVCYHREGSPVYVRVSTLLVERGTDVVIDSDSPNVLIDQDVELVQSASLTRLKVQDKGNLNLRRRSLNVSYFVWSGGSISGKGTINCTGYAKVTTQGYETRQLSVPLYNYGEMTIDVQRLSLERDGAIHNYGNLTLAVSSMGADSISSILSSGRRNGITTYPGSVLRVIALDERSYALLTGRFVFQGGSVLLSGKVNMTDVTSGPDAVTRLKSGSALTVHHARLSGMVILEETSVLTLMEDCGLISAAVTGGGTMRFLGNDALLHSVKVGGAIQASFGIGLTEPISMVIYGMLEFGVDTAVHVTNAHFVTSTSIVKVAFLGRFVSDFVSTRFMGNIILQVSGEAVLYGNMSDEAITPPLIGTDPLGYVLPLVTTSVVSPNATVYIVDTFGLDEIESSATLLVSAAFQRSVPFLDRLSSDPMTCAAAPYAERPCEVFLPTSQFWTMSGRLVLRGCLQAPSGGTISGAVVKLEDATDWSRLHQLACASPSIETTSHLCALLRHPTPRLRSGLALSENAHLRSPASIHLDELTLIRSSVRVVGSVPITLKDTLNIGADATLNLVSGTVVSARHTIIEGKLILNDPRHTVMRGIVEVKQEGVIELQGTQGSPCSSDFQIEGSLILSPDVRGSPFLCLGRYDDVNGMDKGDAGGLTTSPHGVDKELRRRALANLPHNMECPDEVLHEFDEKLHFITDFWKVEPFNPPPGEPRLRDMMWMTLFGVVSSLFTFHILLGMWGYTYREWWADMRAPCPLHLTLTWDELSYSTVNYFSFCRLIIISLQKTMAAFHPGLPAPLPTVAGVFLRGMALLMPHHQTSIDRARKVGIMYVVWLLFFLYLRGRGSWLHRHLRRRHPFLMDVVHKISIIFTILNFIFLAQLMSSVLDTIAWPTLLRNVPSRDVVSFGPWVMISVVSFVSMGIMAPSSILINQMRMPHMDLRVRAANLLLYFTLQMLETVMWKVFYNSPMWMVFNCAVFQSFRLALMYLSPPTAYQNVNRFMFLLAMQSFYVYLTVALYAVLVRTGVYTNCTQGSELFRFVAAGFAISLFVNFWRNVLFVEEQTSTTGDVSIDALRCSMSQIRNRIHELKMNVYAHADSQERENTLNAIARLRIEYLEKQERYRFETHRLLRPFILGGSVLDAESSLPAHGNGYTYSPYGTEEGSPVLPIASPGSQHSGLLTVEEMETFSCGPALGKGSYGTVHLGILTNGKLVAVKYVNVVSESPEALATVKAEVDMLRELSHPNIIRYFGAHTMNDTMLVFMEFAVGGSLTSIVRKFTHLTEAVMQLYTFQILKGLQYLHDKGVVHRDIKGENILIDGYGIAKLADFGCSKSLANIANASQVGCGTLVGSPFWMAPEVIRSEAYGTKADIWSVGCTVVEMLNGGEPPWREDFDNVYSAMFYVGSTNNIPQIPEDTSELCRSFLYRCFERDVMKRAFAEELLQHPWLMSAAAAASHSEDSNENFPFFSTFSSPTVKSTSDGRRFGDFPRDTPLSSRDDLTSPLNGNVCHHPHSSINSSPTTSRSSTSSNKSR